MTFNKKICDKLNLFHAKSFYNMNILACLLFYSSIFLCYFKANQIGITTAYYHFMFTTLDLPALEFMPSANVTALQMYRSNDPNLQRIKASFTSRHIESKKRALKYLPVRHMLMFCYTAICCN